MIQTTESYFSYLSDPVALDLFGSRSTSRETMRLNAKALILLPVTSEVLLTAVSFAFVMLAASCVGTVEVHLIVDTFTKERATESTQYNLIITAT